MVINTGESSSLVRGRRGCEILATGISPPLRYFGKMKGDYFSFEFLMVHQHMTICHPGEGFPSLSKKFCKHGECNTIFCNFGNNVEEILTVGCTAYMLYIYLCTVLGIFVLCLPLGEGLFP